MTSNIIYINNQVFTILFSKIKKIVLVSKDALKMIKRDSVTRYIFLNVLNNSSNVSFKNQKRGIKVIKQHSCF